MADGSLLFRQKTGAPYLSVADRVDYIPAESGENGYEVCLTMLLRTAGVETDADTVRRVLKDGGSFYCATYGENGMMEYIGSLFRGYGIETRVNANFTLQNGAEKLSPFFAEVKRDLYEDALLVTDVEDLVDYIFSLAGMTDLRKLPRETIREVLSRHMVDGVLRIPKEYGMFIARK